MKITQETTEQEKEQYRQIIKEKAIKLGLDKLNKLTRGDIRKNPELLGTADHITRLFGSWSKFKESFNLEGYYKTDEDIIEAVKRVSCKTNLTQFSREFYLSNREPGDPSAAAQYNFMRKHNIQSYSNFINYCINFSNQYTQELNKKTEDHTEQDKKIQELLDKGLYDKEIERDYKISSTAVRRYRQKNNIENQYKKDLEENRS
jgi:hypothetical protein